MTETPWPTRGQHRTPREVAIQKLLDDALAANERLHIERDTLAIQLRDAIYERDALKATLAEVRLWADANALYPRGGLSDGN